MFGETAIPDMPDLFFYFNHYNEKVLSLGLK